MASPITTVRDELSLVHTLLELMKQEQRLLVAADTDGLTAITPQKNQLIGQLAALSAERHQHLAAAGLPAEDAAMQTWLDEQKDKGAASLWQDLLSATREAKELNRVNGMLISKHLTANQQLINAMRTPSAGGDATVYGPTGQTAPAGPSRRYVIG